MNNGLILHHYDNSPYAEKIRLMFGLTHTRWQSLQVPVQPPRPSLDPLTGGYRRIPVAQQGADIFCDTAVIAREVASLTDCAALDPGNVQGNAAALMKQAEKEIFFAAITAVSPLRLMGTLLLEFGPIGGFRFIKDRAGLLKGGSVRAPQGKRAKATLESFLNALETQLAEHPWLGGDTASVADFAVYHPLWLHVASTRRPLNAGPKVRDWYKKVGQIGHGDREEIDEAQAFSVARESEPRALPASIKNSPVEIGASVSVRPSDYGTVPVQGTLAAITNNRIIVARDTPDFGTLHVHFPRSGYSLKAN